MAKLHSKAERQQLKSMLSDAVRVLCQNTVRYNAQLSVEGLIGITVDGGRDVLIVSLSDIISKQTADTTFDEGQYYDDYDDSQYADDYMDEENAADTDGAAGQEYAYTRESVMPCGTVVKEELMSTISYNNAGPNLHQPVATTPAAAHQYKPEPYVDNTEQYYEESTNQQNIGFQHSWPSASGPSAPVAGKSRAAGTGAQKQAKSAASPAAKQSGRFGGGKVSQDGGGGGKQQKLLGKTKPLNDGGDAVSQITLYTCGTCGAQMQHHGSFLRHKQSHTTQQTFHCDGCGKAIRRHDNLLKHQRTCQPYHDLLNQRGDHTF